MAKKKKSLFEDPVINAFYNSLMGTGAGANYSYTAKEFATANRATSGGKGKKKPGSKYASVNELANQVDQERDRNAAYGGKNEKTNKRPGVLSRMLDVISRPNYAVMQGINRALVDADKNDASFWSQITSFGKGAKQGITGKKKTTGSDLLRKQYSSRMKEHPVSGATLGLFMDIFLDPTTYVGLGLASKVGRVGKVTQKSKKMKDTLKAIGVTDDDAIRTLSHAAYTEGKQTKAAARNARKAVDEAAEFASKIEGDKVFKSIMAAGGDATRARHQSQIAKGKMTLELRKLADEILDAPGYRNIALKSSSGLGQKGIEIPLSRYLVGAAAALPKGIGKFDPAKKAADKFVEKFSNSAGIFPEMQRLRLEHRSSGLARVHHRGEYLTKTFGVFSKTEREDMWADALAGNFDTGKVIKDFNGHDHDASEFIASRIRNIQHRFTDRDTLAYGIDDLALDPEDINRFSKYGGIIFKKKGDDPDWVLNSLKEAKVKDAGEALFITESAMEQALARRTMLRAFGDTWGARMGKVDDLAKKYKVKPSELPAELRPYRNWRNLQHDGWIEVTDKANKPIKELEGVLFDPETAKGMKKILGLLDDEREMQGFLRGINKMTGMWKFFVTVPNPGFHIRNSIGDMYINMMDDVTPVAYTKAGQLIHRKAMFETPGAGMLSPLMTMPHNIQMQAAKGFRPVTGRYKDKFLKLRKPITDKAGNPIDWISEAEIWAAYNRYGMRQNYTISEYGKAFDEKSLRGGLLSKVKDPLVRWSENREDYFRLAHFMDLVEKNPSKAKSLDEIFSFAAARVSETHFDYTDFTKFEKHTMSNAIPFYKWTRKSLPLQTELLFTQPGKVAVIPKMMRALSESMGYDWESWNYLNTERVVPEWMRTAGYLPGKFNALPGMSGPQQYFNIASPFGDAANQWATPVSDLSFSGISKQLSSMLNPGIKVPGEFAFNERAYTGQEVYNPNDPTSTKLKDWATYLSEQTPITRIGGKAIRQQDTTPAAAWSWLLGISMQPNTEQRQISELYRQRDNTRGRYKQTRARFLKKNNLPPSTRLQ